MRSMQFHCCFRRGLTSVSVLLLAASLSGCLTHSTIEHTKEYSYTNSEGDKKIVWEAKPGLYAVVPFAVLGDIALTPVYVLYFAFTIVVQ